MSHKSLSATIPIEHLEEVRKHVAKLAARAARKGMPVPDLEQSAPYFIPDPSFVPSRYSGVGLIVPQIEVVDVAILAPDSIALGGWSLVGRVDTLPDGSAFVARTPGTEATPLPPIADPKACAYCHKRRIRCETFLVGQPNGEIVQVGRSCLRDFLGHDPAALLWWHQSLSGLKTSIGGFAGFTGIGRVYLTDDILTLAARVAAQVGYLSRTRARAINDQIDANGLGGAYVSTTAEIVGWRLGPPLGLPPRKLDRATLAWELRYPDDAPARSLLALTRTQLSRVLATPANEWEASLAQIVKLPVVRARHLGVATSAVLLGLKEQERIAKAKVLPPSAHLGAVGERLRGLEAEITFTKSHVGGFGPETLLKFQSATALLGWWGTGTPGHGGYPNAQAWQVGDQVILDGTVSAHEADRYDGRSITMLKRCVLKSRP
jgi:hypothetical protein